MKLRSMILVWLLCAPSLWAGWNTNAWPSTNHFRFNTNTVVTVSNVYAQHHSESWSQSCTPSASTIPEISVTGFAFGGAYIGTLPAINANTRTWTNTYLTDIQVATGILTTWGPGTANYSHYFTNVVDGVTNITTTALSHYTNGVQTNINLNVRELWAWDSYMAMKERDDALSLIYGTNLFTTYPPAKPRFYRAERDALLALKTWLGWNTGLYAPSAWLIPADTVDTNTWELSSAQTELPWTSNVVVNITTQMLFDVGSPSNYITFTPWRNLGGNYAGETRLTTGTWTFVTPGTFEVYTTCGNLYTQIVATNISLPFTNTFVCTNLDIAEGYTSADYGWKKVPAMFDTLTMLTVENHSQGGFKKTATGVDYADLVVNWNAASWSTFDNADYRAEGITGDPYTSWSSTRWRAPTNGPVTFNPVPMYTAVLYGQAQPRGTGFADVDSLGFEHDKWVTFSNSIVGPQTGAVLNVSVGDSTTVVQDASGYVSDMGLWVKHEDLKWIILYQFDYRGVP